MRKYIQNSPYMLPVTMVMLTAASWETIARLLGVVAKSEWTLRIGERLPLLGRWLQG
jgi:hypothetical protein